MKRELQERLHQKEAKHELKRQHAQEIYNI